jgi:hypothetical protein
MRLRAFSSVLLAGAVLLSSSAALAASIFYGDLLTSDKFALLENRHATASLGVDFASFSITPDWTLDAAGTGLGAGKIPPAKTYTHSIDAPAGATIEKAWLFVSFSDDGFDLQPETGVVDLSGLVLSTNGIVSGYQAPSPLTEIVSGDVTANLASSPDGKLVVTVSTASANQDMYIHASLLKVQYSTGGGAGGPGSAVPEPGALLVFAVGLAVTAAGLRGRGIAPA